ARVTYIDRWGPDERDRIPDGETEPKRGYQFSGRFVDISDLAHGLSGTEFDTLAQAAEAFGVEVPPERQAAPADIAGLMERAFRRLTVEARLYAKLLLEHEAR